MTDIVETPDLGSRLARGVELSPSSPVSFQRLLFFFSARTPAANEEGVFGKAQRVRTAMWLARWLAASSGREDVARQGFALGDDEAGMTVTLLQTCFQTTNDRGSKTEEVLGRDEGIFHTR